MSQELATLEPILEINLPVQPDQQLQPAPTEPQQVSYLCRHIFTDGHRCSSPAMRRENFCYYHHAHRKPTLKRHAYRQHPDLGLKSLDDLEDRASVQLSLAEVLRRVASNSIDPRRAGLLLYGLQIASHNLGRPSATPPPAASDIVNDIIHGHIAASEPGRFPEDSDPAAAAARLLREAAALHPISQTEVHDQPSSAQDFTPKQGEGGSPISTKHGNSPSDISPNERSLQGDSMRKSNMAKPTAPNATPARTTGLSPKEQKLAALRAKLAHAETATPGSKPVGASAQSFSAKTSFAGKKTSFQRKAV